MQQRARKAAVRAMATVCAAIPKPDLRDPDLLGADIKKTAVGQPGCVPEGLTPAGCCCVAATNAPSDQWDKGACLP